MKLALTFPKIYYVLGLFTTAKSVLSIVFVISWIPAVIPTQKMSDKEVEEEPIAEVPEPTEEPEKSPENGKAPEITKEAESSSDEEWIGPLPSEAASEQPPAKKRKVLLYEKLFLESLPNSESYEKSGRSL